MKEPGTEPPTVGSADEGLPIGPHDATAITGLLSAWRSGDAAAGERLMQALYGELHRMASRRVRREPRGATLQTTELVHEAFLRLVDQHRVAWQDRAHFLALAATMMRRILVDRARARQAQKRGGGAAVVELAEAAAAVRAPAEELLDLDRALERLAAQYPRPAKVVELRFFGGLDEAEIGDFLSLNVRTVRRDWAFASAWLCRELAPRGAS